MTQILIYEQYTNTQIKYRNKMNYIDIYKAICAYLNKNRVEKFVENRAIHKNM